MLMMQDQLNISMNAIVNNTCTGVMLPKPGAVQQSVYLTELLASVCRRNLHIVFNQFYAYGMLRYVYNA